MKTAKPTLIDAADSLPKKVESLQHFLADQFFDDAGFMYAMWYFKDGELRPFVASDFEGMSVFKLKAGITMEDHHNYENSPYTSGAFLWSQVLRYQVTQEEEALRYAAKAFRSIELNFDLCAANGERGMLCKPYNKKFSHETSPDQCVTCIMGMWAYREIADEKTRRKIDEIIPAMSDWWRNRNYKLVYFDHEGDWLHPPHMIAQYGPFYAVLHVMAHRITGQQVYRDEADRVLALVGAFPARLDIGRELWLTKGEHYWPEQLHGYEYDPARRPFLQLDWQTYGAMWMPSVSTAWLLKNEPPLKHLAQHALANYFRNMRKNLTPELMILHWSQTDLDTGKNYPLSRPRISTDRKDNLVFFDWNFFAYASKVCWGDATARLPHVALMAHHLAGAFAPGALTLTKAMLGKLDDARMQWFIDPDGKQLMPEDRWMAHVLSSEAPAFTCLTYWQARQWGIELQ